MTPEECIAAQRKVWETTPDVVRDELFDAYVTLAKCDPNCSHRYVPPRRGNEQ